MLLPDYNELVALGRHADPEGWGSRRKVMSEIQGAHVSLFQGRGLDFSEFREYSPGDDVRSIDWRVTARKGRPYTKIFTEERERAVYIIVDLNSYMQFGTRNTFKSVQAARAAALLAWTSHHLNDKTGVLLFGQCSEGIKFLPARRSRKSIWEMLRSLCQPEDIHRRVSLSEALEIADRYLPIGASIFVISDFVDLGSHFEKNMGLLSRRREVSLVKVNDPADMHMPDAGRIQLSDHQGHKMEVNTSDRRGLELYQQLWQQSEMLLEDVAKKFRLKTLRIKTDGNVAEDLSREFRQLKRNSR